MSSQLSDPENVDLELNDIHTISTPQVYPAFPATRLPVIAVGDELQADDIVSPCAPLLPSERSGSVEITTQETVRLTEVLPDHYNSSSTTPRAIQRHLYDVTYASLELISPWFPFADPNNPRAKTWRTWKSRRETVLWFWFGIDTSIFLINLISTFIAWTKFPVSSNIITLYTGDCDVTKKLDIGLHVLINVLSTALLSASNGCLQLTVAPTRGDVSRAHSKNTWLDIGVPSFRNLRHVGRGRLLVFCALWLSAIPVHFLYNSAIFTAVPSSIYTYAVVTEGFLTEQPNGSIYDPASDTNTGFHEIAPDATNGSLSELRIHNSSFAAVVKMYYDVQANLTLFENLTSFDCWQKYQGPFDTPPPPVLLVSNITGNQSLLHWQSLDPLTGDPLSTLSGGGESLNFWLWTNNWPYLGPDPTEEDAAYWTSHGNQIQYCLRRPAITTPENAMSCHLQASPAIMIVLCISNGLLCSSVLWTIIRRRRTEKSTEMTKPMNPEQSSKSERRFEETELCTLGDAIASFLEYPDESTKNLGIVSRSDIDRLKNGWEDISVVTWQRYSIRWHHAASLGRWSFAMITSSIILALGLGAFASGWATERYYTYASTLKGLWQLGFGTPSTKELISIKQPTDGTAGLFVNVIITNIWQVLLSMAYVANNAVLSSMLVADEWTGFALDRKFLRVSSPKGSQRSSYFISMPFRYGLPIMAMFSFEHWLLSQTTFIIRVVLYQYVDDAVTTTQYTTSGYSLAPAMLAIIFPVIIIIGQLLNAFLRKYPSSLAMPLASTCSAAISAACHRPFEDKDAHLMPVQWGVIENDNPGPTRCSFTTSRDTFAPEPGKEYLGNCPAVLKSATWCSKIVGLKSYIPNIGTIRWRRTGRRRPGYSPALN